MDSTVIPFPQCRGGAHTGEHFRTNRTSEVHYLPRDTGWSFACCADCGKWVNCHGEVLSFEEVRAIEDRAQARASEEWKRHFDDELLPF